MPRVSVVIPTYNRAHLLRRAVDSVLNQTFNNIEIIVVDDGSTDNTKDFINKRYGGLITYIYQENKGAPAARNRGFEHSSGDFITFLDSDDYFLPENIEKKVNILEDHHDVGWIFSDFFQATDDKRDFKKCTLPRRLSNKLKSTTEVFDHLLIHGGFARTIAVMVRRECLIKVGAFDPELKAHQDCEFSLRLAKHFKAKYIPEPLVVSVIHQGDTISSSRNRYLATSIYIDKIRNLYPEDVRRLNWPPRWSKWIADTYNYLGMEYLASNDKKKARNQFLRSIKTYPLQGRIYYLLLKSLI